MIPPMHTPAPKPIHIPIGIFPVGAPIANPTLIPTDINIGR